MRSGPPLGHVRLWKGPISSPTCQRTSARARFDESGRRVLLVERARVLRTETYRDGIARDTRLNCDSLVKGQVGALALRTVTDERLVGLDVSLRRVLGPDALDATVGAALAMVSGLVLTPEPPKTLDTKLDEAGFWPLGSPVRLHDQAWRQRWTISAYMRDYGANSTTKAPTQPTSASCGRGCRDGRCRKSCPSASECRRDPEESSDGAIWQGKAYPMTSAPMPARPPDRMRVGRFLLDSGSLGNPFSPEPSGALLFCSTSTRRHGGRPLRVTKCAIMCSILQSITPRGPVQALWAMEARWSILCHRRMPW